MIGRDIKTSLCRGHTMISIVWVCSNGFLGSILFLGGLDKPVHRKKFKLSHLTVLILLKIMFVISSRTLASAPHYLKVCQILVMKQAPCCKTIQNTLQYLQGCFLREINRMLIPSASPLGGMDSSGIKIDRKETWVIIRFHRP